MVNSLGSPECGTVSMSRVSHRYETPAGPVNTLIDAELSVSGGEMVAVLGPSGSGKSTLLGIIGGWIRPTSGEVGVCGKRWGELSGRHATEWQRDNIGAVFQHPNLVSVLNVRQNVLLPLVIGRHVPRRQRDGRVNEALERFSVAELADRWVEQLSGGQQQRVAIARATVGGQPLILADEPTGSLDAANSTMVFEALFACAAAGGAVVVVSHDLAVTSFASRILRLSEGKLTDD